MTLEELLKTKNISVYQCSKQSGVPYTTLLELIRGKTQIGKCSAETVYKLAKVLHITIEELIEVYTEKSKDIPYRSSFETFKSNICHMVKDKGDIDFIIDTLTENEIRKYWDRKWYSESFYLLAMVDYLCKENQLPVCTDYEDIRGYSLPKLLYPRDISLAAKLAPKLDVREQSIKEAIPEFIRFNIVESRIRNVY